MRMILPEQVLVVRCVREVLDFGLLGDRHMCLLLPVLRDGCALAQGLLDEVTRILIVRLQ